MYFKKLKIWNASLNAEVLGFFSDFILSKSKGDYPPISGDEVISP